MNVQYSRELCHPLWLSNRLHQHRLVVPAAEPIARAIVAPPLAPAADGSANDLSHRSFKGSCPLASPPTQLVIECRYRERLLTALDAELPGGGWPHRALTELLLPSPRSRRVAPAGASARAHRGLRLTGPQQVGRSVMLFDPPAALCGPGRWRGSASNAQQLLVVYGREGARARGGLRRLLPSADLLWALEQALKSGHVGAVLAWLPQRLKADALRRLQLAAQSHDGPSVPVSRGRCTRQAQRCAAALAAARRGHRSFVGACAQAARSTADRSR